MGSYQYWAGRVYDLCVYFVTGTPEGSTESGFMEKPGIEHATPVLQDIGFPLHKKKMFYGFPGYKPVPPDWFKICVLVL